MEKEAFYLFFSFHCSTQEYTWDYSTMLSGKICRILSFMHWPSREKLWRFPLYKIFLEVTNSAKKVKNSYIPTITYLIARVYSWVYIYLVQLVKKSPYNRGENRKRYPSFFRTSTSGSRVRKQHVTYSPTSLLLAHTTNAATEIRVHSRLLHKRRPRKAIVMKIHLAHISWSNPVYTWVS